MFPELAVLPPPPTWTLRRSRWVVREKLLAGGTRTNRTEKVFRGSRDEVWETGATVRKCLRTTVFKKN